MQCEKKGLRMSNKNTLSLRERERVRVGFPD